MDSVAARRRPSRWRSAAERRRERGSARRASWRGGGGGHVDGGEAATALAEGDRRAVETRGAGAVAAAAAWCWRLGLRGRGARNVAVTGARGKEDSEKRGGSDLDRSITGRGIRAVGFNDEV